MAEDAEDVAVLLWYCWEESYMGEKRKRLWVHPINEKREKENTMQKFLQELRCDENKFQNFTRLSLETFYFIFNLSSDKMRSKYSNYRRSITAEKRLCVTLS
jgi:hypothetical protein